MLDVPDCGQEDIALACSVASVDGVTYLKMTTSHLQASARHAVKIAIENVFPKRRGVLTSTSPGPGSTVLLSSASCECAWYGRTFLPAVLAHNVRSFRSPVVTVEHAADGADHGVLHMHTCTVNEEHLRLSGVATRTWKRTWWGLRSNPCGHKSRFQAVSYTHLRAHET